MALFVKQDDKRSELQKRIAADIQNRTKDFNRTPGDEPDGVEDSRYVEGTKKTTSLAWVWLLIVIAFIALLTWLTLKSL